VQITSGPCQGCHQVRPRPHHLIQIKPTSLPHRESKWSKPGSGLKIVPIVTAKQTFTPGDALRDIYTHGIITNDFVLVTGDLVSNIRIDEVVRVHKERRKVDRDAIMTMVVKESGVVHRTRSARVTSGIRARADRLSTETDQREKVLSLWLTQEPTNYYITSR